MLIISIKPELTRDEAERKFKGMFREMKRGPLQQVIDFYIPYRLFEISITSASKITESLVAIYSVTGEAGLYKFKRPPDDESHIRIDTDRVARKALSEPQSFSALKEKMSRASSLRGLFKARRFQLKAHCVDDFYIPYWIGIYKRDDVEVLEVIDAVKGSFEGSSNREIIVRWFGAAGAGKSLSSNQKKPADKIKRRPR